MDNKLKIRALFERFFRTADLKDTDDIFALGLVTSLFAMQLIVWLEKEYSITITDEDLDIHNFNTVKAIDAFVGRKISVPSCASTREITREQVSEEG